MIDFSNIKSIEEYWIDGFVSDGALSRWKELQNKSPIELSSLIPLIRITVYQNRIINSLENPRELNFTTPIQNTEQFRGNYGIESIKLSPTGYPPGIIFDIDIKIKVFNPSLLDSNDPINCLTRLNNTVRIDFGWNDRGITSAKDLDNITKTSGNGFSLFGVVIESDIDIDNKFVTSLSVKIRSLNSTIMSTINLKSILPNSFSIENIKITDKTYYGERGINYIRLYDIYEYITNTLNTIVENLKFNIIIPVFNLNAEIYGNWFKYISSPISKNITITNNKMSSVKIGDICVNIIKVKEIYINSTTLSNFTEKLLKFINKELKQVISLSAKAIPPAGKTVIIYNTSQENPIEKISKERKENYLTIDFKNRNGIIKEFSISKNLDNSKDLQNFIDMNAGESIPNDLMESMLLWYLPQGGDIKIVIPQTTQLNTRDTITTTPINFTYTTADALGKSVPKQSDERKRNSNTIISENDIKKMNERIQKLKVNNSILKFLPYSMSITILGISDLWIGNRIKIINSPFTFLNFDSSINENTVWRITDISHDVSNNKWYTSITAITERIQKVTFEKSSISSTSENKNNKTIQQEYRGSNIKVGGAFGG